MQTIYLKHLKILNTGNASLRKITLNDMWDEFL